MHFLNFAKTNCKSSLLGFLLGLKRSGNVSHGFTEEHHGLVEPLRRPFRHSLQRNRCLAERILPSSTQVDVNNFNDKELRFEIRGGRNADNPKIAIPPYRRIRILSGGRLVALMGGKE